MDDVDEVVPILTCFRNNENLPGLLLFADDSLPPGIVKYEGLSSPILEFGTYLSSSHKWHCEVDNKTGKNVKDDVTSSVIRFNLSTR